ncbi:MAG: TIGR01212 family radical SAM protein [Lachnospirales bacterium]
MRYYTYSNFLKDKFGEKVSKIAVDGGFTCPNRDGTLSYGGCIFCSEDGSGDFTAGRNFSIHEQFIYGKALLKSKWNSNKFIIYFQSYTNTYGDVDSLRKKYEEALAIPNVIGLSIATRCDAINDKVVELLADLNKEHYISVEIGLQTSNEESRKNLNSCFTNESYVKAMKLLRERNIDVVTHLIIGLPKESKNDFLNSLQFAIMNGTTGLKLQLLHILKGTKIADMYKNQPFYIMPKEEYIDIIVDLIEHMPKNIVIHRITGDGKKDDLIEPVYSLNKRSILNGISKEMKNRDTYQGSKWEVNMTYEEKLAKYANACITVGINLKKDQMVCISSPIDCSGFARLVAKEAYLAGASDVELTYSDEKFTKVRYDLAPDSAFEICSDWVLAKRQEALNKGAVFISISSSDPDILKDCDQKKIALNSKTTSIKMKPFSDALMNNQSQWLVISVPSDAYAKKVFPDKSLEDAKAALWDAIFAACRIDEGSPKENWDRHIKTLHEKSKFLNESKFEKLVFKNSFGTDLEIYLPEKNIWAGGGDYTIDGHFFLPNMPTEEVFGMPHRNKVNGVVKSSKPLNYRGNLIDNFSLTFKDGEVVEYSAESGYDTLKGMLETDDGARRIGEVALVPYASPISLSNLLFYNTLFDENASCHLALGRAYPTNLDGGETMDRETLAEHGANDSLIHVDFMFGTKDLNITGYLKDGTSIEIFTNGNWSN